MSRFALAAAVGTGALILYLCALPPGLAWWDTGEYQTVPYIAGILHPTGFPAYTISGWLFSHAFVVGNVAWRMSVMAALTGAGAAAVLAYTARTLGASALAALAAGVLFATSDITWQHATHAGVESLTLLFGALAVASAAAWYQNRRGGALVRTGLFLGLALATHPVALWFVPGIAIFVAAGAWRRRALLRPLAFAAVALAAALALYAYLPLRSAAITAAHVDPVARVLGVPGQPFWDYDHPSTVAGFVQLVTGADFRPTSALAALREPARIPGYLARLRDLVVTQYGWAGALVALAGVAATLRRWPLALGLIVTAILVIPFSLTYDALVDPDKYYLVGMWIVALFGALGVSAFGRFEAAAALVLAAAIGVNITHNLHFFGQRTQHDGNIVITSVRTNTPDNAVIYAGWSYVTPLAYAAYVEKSFGDRIPVTNATRNNLAAWSKQWPVYYMPFPEDDLNVPGARLEPVANAWPKLYRVRALSSRAH